MGWHMLPVQIPVQQSLAPAHTVPVVRHVKPHTWLALHDRPQQSVPCAQAAPMGVQLPPVGVHWCVVLSQAPEQQPTPVVHVAPLALHDIIRLASLPPPSLLAPSRPPSPPPP